MSENKLLEQNFKKKFFSKAFYEYCSYYFREYFSFDTPECLKKYYSALASWKNVYFKWFRWSAKTTIAQMYVSWCIAYKKEEILCGIVKQSIMQKKT